MEEKMKMLFLPVVLVLIWSKQENVFALQGCGSVVNNSLKSPGYPNNYPSDMHCVYSIPIPQGMALNISFKDFFLEEDEYWECSYDYLKITDGKSHTFGIYCGKRAGQSVSVAGDHVILTFYSDDIEQRRGFLIVFSAIPIVFPEVTLPYTIVRTLPGFKLFLCSTKGTPPVYTALTRNSTVIINTTNTDVTIRLHEEGNYSCVATGKYGVQVKEFSVIFNDCANRCSYEWRNLHEGNFLSCRNLTLLAYFQCVPKATQWL